MPRSGDIDNVSEVLKHEDMFTVSHLKASYEAHLQVQCKLRLIRPGTLAFYSSQLRKLEAAVGQFPAASLRAEHLVSCELTNHFVRVLKSLYRWGSDDEVGLVPRNPFAKLKTPRCGQRTRTLTIPEFRRLLRATTPAFRWLLRAALYTGSRPGELRDLTWGSVDLPNRVFRLTKFKAQERRKDHKGIRAIPISRRLSRLLCHVHRAQRPRPTDHVFLNMKRQPWTSNAVRCAMRSARSAAGLADGGEKVVLYTLRHTFATRSTRNGVQPKILAEMMGHTTTKMTERYQHLVAEDLVAAIDKATS